MLILGVAIILTCRVLLKPLAKLVVTGFYNLLDLKYYSYSQMCKDLGNLQPTKRYTNRMRFKPIPGMKVGYLDNCFGLFFPLADENTPVDFAYCYGNCTLYDLGSLFYVYSVIFPILLMNRTNTLQPHFFRFPEWILCIFGKAGVAA